jgi:hypothetical protein
MAFGHYRNANPIESICDLFEWNKNETKMKQKWNKSETKVRKKIVYLFFFIIKIENNKCYKKY